MTTKATRRMRKAIRDAVNADGNENTRREILDRAESQTGATRTGLSRQFTGMVKERAIFPAFVSGTWQLRN